MTRVTKAKMDMLREIKTLNLGDRIFNVRPLPKSLKGQMGGQYRPQDGIIYVQAEYSYQLQVNTLVHEALHHFTESLLVDVTNLAYVVEETTKANETVMEIYNRHLEFRIMTLLRLNPLLLKWIKKTNG